MSSSERPEVCAMGRPGRQPKPGCTCPDWRYHPPTPRPTNPDCPKHGTDRTPRP